ncbi:ATP-binding protein [Cellulomonas iranensis]|uniref:Signal transduction histidine kinase/phage shock protein PspC (Stress-responsive transcriptional regulator) n=1 Tax=Cellulomonas iranensis TaxID=76862 RepID=A0ABU0GLU8_9CELL|nr:ATP-binding protein [Cellulomonas iranensis]MDQ0426330.1 signal transduction histidine kinase/phage shock protein PspC (stress-responsive transcriptional regulator) [Cellulomonas iranensis]
MTTAPAPFGAPPRPAAVPRVRLPLRRPEQGRWFAGVATGLSAHLALPAAVVRVALVLLVPFAGTGLALYVFWWLAVPVGDPAAAAAAARPSTLQRLARRQPLRADGRRVPWAELALGALLVLAAAVLVAMRLGAQIDAAWALPVLVVLLGLALAWSQLDAVQRSRGDGRRISVLRLIGGGLLAGAGVLLLAGQVGGQGVEPALLVQSAVAGLAVLLGVGLVLAPWWVRLVRELGDERAARAREAERADIAAHLHDSVLQTLALIRARADEPVEVARMARAQERELREWLYDDRHEPGTSLVAALRAVVAEVEDSRSGPSGEAVAVDVVVVGDRVPEPDTLALLQATREALVNAVVHGRPPVSLYLEVGPELVEVFVRDRGDGFDLDAVGPDRFGVRESIMGRVRRRGGTARVSSSPERGTEVHLAMPVGRGGSGTDEDEERGA